MGLGWLGYDRCWSNRVGSSSWYKPLRCNPVCSLLSTSTFNEQMIIQQLIYSFLILYIFLLFLQWKMSVKLAVQSEELWRIVKGTELRTNSIILSLPINFCEIRKVFSQCECNDNATQDLFSLDFWSLFSSTEVYVRGRTQRIPPESNRRNSSSRQPNYCHN